MALKLRKLSEIASAPAAPAITDTVVGVGGGTTDYQYTMAQIAATVGGLLPVTQDPRFNVSSQILELFVSTTGNDSNPGTVAQPFLTIQHAVDVATSFDYQGTFGVEIGLAAGTYNLAAPVVCGPLFFTGQFGLGSIFGAGIGSTIINAQGLNTAFQVQYSTLADWSMSLFSIDCNDKCIWVFGGGDMFAALIEFRDSSNSGNMVCMFGEDYAICEMSNITVNTTTFRSLYGLRFNSQGFLLNNVTLPVAVTVTGGFIDCMQNSACQFTPTSITNAGGVTGSRFNLTEQSGVWTNNGLTSDVPGTTNGNVDVTSALTNQNHTFPFSVSTKASIFAQQFAGTPTNTDISDGCWTVVKDTSGGAVYVLYNDAGTIKKVALV